MSLGIQTPRLFHLLCAKRRRRISSAVNGFDFVDKVRQRVLRQATRVSPSHGSLRASQRCGKIADDVAERNVAAREQDWTTLSALLQAAAEQAEKDLSTQGDNGASSVS
jgi:hypothetical protein